VVVILSWHLPAAHRVDLPLIGFGDVVEVISGGSISSFSYLKNTISSVPDHFLGSLFVPYSLQVF
jgi:hypothetical protein